MLVCIGVIALPAAVMIVVAAALSAPVLTGGWFGALGLVRAVSVIGVRDMERRGRVEYHLRTAASRRRVQRYFVTSPAPERHRLVP